MFLGKNDDGGDDDDDDMIAKIHSDETTGNQMFHQMKHLFAFSIINKWPNDSATQWQSENSRYDSTSTSTTHNNNNNNNKQRVTRTTKYLFPLILRVNEFLKYKMFSRLHVHCTRFLFFFMYLSIAQAHIDGSIHWIVVHSHVRCYKLTLCQGKNGVWFNNRTLLIF